MKKVPVAALARALLRPGLFAHKRAGSRPGALPVCPPWRHIIKRGLIEVRVADDSMAPRVPRGATLLVNRSRREWAELDVIAVRIDGSVIAVRAAHDTAGRRLMVTDNPDWPNVPLPAGAEIVGRALCVARALY